VEGVSLPTARVAEAFSAARRGREIFNPSNIMNRLRHSVVSLSLLALVSSGARAQSILVPSSANSNALRTESLTSTSSVHRAASNFASALSSDDPLFQRGPIGVRPHLVFRALYGEGIEAGPGNPRDSFIESVAPGVLFDLGKYCHLDYTPTWTFYSNPAFRDTFDQTASLSARVPHSRGMVGAAESYESSYAMLVETGRQTHQVRYSTLVEGTEKLGQHVLLEASASRTARYANAVTDAPEWTTSDWVQWSATTWLRYEFSPRLDVGAGFTYGYAAIGVGANMSFTQPQARISWKPAEKISFSAQFGEEKRRFESGTRATLKSPVYTGSATYQLLPTTKLSVDAVRSVSASYFANELTKSKGWNIGLEQRLIQKLYLAVSVSEQDTQYIATRTTLLVERNDRYRAMNLRLTAVVLHRISLALIYQSARNATADAGYAFRSNQYGVEASMRF
jgi:hypothetical protein